MFAGLDLEFRIIPATLSIPEGQTSDLTVQLNVAADRAVSVTVASGGGTATAGMGCSSSICLVV